jgi:hypothetical protein
VREECANNPPCSPLQSAHSFDLLGEQSLQLRGKVNDSAIAILGHSRIEAQRARLEIDMPALQRKHLRPNTPAERVRDDHDHLQVWGKLPSDGPVLMILEEAVPGRSLLEHVDRWHAEHLKELFETVDALVDVTMGRIVFALAGVYSQSGTLADRRRVVEDLVSIPGWNYSGASHTAEAPLGLVYLFHHLHGALCCELGRTDLALQMAETSLIGRHRSDESAFLWRRHDVSGWPALLGGNCREAWNYLVRLPNRFKVLEEFFALQHDFEVGLASYSALLSLLEAARDCTKLLGLGKEGLQRIRSVDVPPSFLVMGYEVVQAATARIFKSPEVVRQVTERANVKRDELKRFWPYWTAALHHLHRGSYPFADNVPLGELA